jgi:hypothetical protein
MGDRPKYITGYAVIRIDLGPVEHPSHVQEYQRDGEVLPAAGPCNVRVKEIVTTQDVAQREVIRLNRLNSSKGCRYYWQTTHIFLDGTSHGSTTNAIEPTG